MSNINESDFEVSADLLELSLNLLTLQCSNQPIGDEQLLKTIKILMQNLEKVSQPVLERKNKVLLIDAVDQLKNRIDDSDFQEMSIQEQANRIRNLLAGIPSCPTIC
jgi:hypothetical protein